MMCICFNNVVSSKTKKLVDGRATLPKKFTDIEIVCKVSHQEMLTMHTVHVAKPKFQTLPDAIIIVRSPHLL